MTAFSSCEAGVSKFVSLMCGIIKGVFLYKLYITRIQSHCSTFIWSTAAYSGSAWAGLKLTCIKEAVAGPCRMQAPSRGLGTSAASPGKERAAQGQAPHPGSHSAVPLRAAPCLLLPPGGLLQYMLIAWDWQHAAVYYIPVILATAQGVLNCHVCHQVFCGLLSRIAQFADILRDSRQQLIKARQSA